jgi:hypothetical protein
MTKTTQTIFTASLVLNALSLFIFLSAAFIKTSSLSFYKMDGKKNTAATAVSVPEGGGVLFNAVEITLKKGQSAALQFSVVSEGKQANRLIETLYDREIIGVSKTGYGLVVTALKAGDASMQALTEYGIRDIAVIHVTE